MHQNNRSVNEQFEECICNLEHENVRMAVVMHDKDPFDRAPHAEILIVVLQTLETR